jgi:predicted lysophospholipase L1 biosynthesis ABC-type transport system permease subunit
VVFTEQLPIAGPNVFPQGITGNQEVRFAYRPEGFGPSDLAPMPALATDTLLTTLGVPPGDEISVGERFADPRRLVAAAALRGFPTIDPARPAAVVDLGVLATNDYVGAGRTLQPAEWWIGVDDAHAEAVAALASGEEIRGTDVVVRLREAAGRSGDPLAIGIVGALALGAAAAGLFAAIGLAIGAIVGVRQRGREIALLRALGLSTRQLVAALSAEHAFLLVIGSVTGIGIGVALAYIVLPAVTLSERATAAVPPVHVEVPIQIVGLLLALAAGAFLLLVALQARSLRRELPAEALRATEDLA